MVTISPFLVSVRPRLCCLRCDVIRYEAMLPIATVAPNLDQGWSTAFSNDAETIQERWTVVNVDKVPESQLQARDQIRKTREDVVVVGGGASGANAGDGREVGSDSGDPDQQQHGQQKHHRESRPRTSFQFTTAADCNVQSLNDSTSLEWSTLMHDYNASPEYRIALRLGSTWWLCKKNMFPTQAFGMAELKQYNVLTMMVHDPRYLWLQLDSETLEVTAPKAVLGASGQQEGGGGSLPSSKTGEGEEKVLTGIGFLSTYYDDEDAVTTLGHVRLQQHDTAAAAAGGTGGGATDWNASAVAEGTTRLSANAKMKAVLASVSGKHLYHNFCDGMTPDHHQAEKNVTAVCRGTVIVDGSEFMVVSVGCWRFEPLQLERILGLAFAIYFGHLPSAILAAAFANDWVIKMPTAPTTSVGLCDAHFDGFENASGVQLRPRLDVIGFATGFRGTLPVRDVAKHKARLRAGVAVREAELSTTATWLAQTLPLEAAETMEQYSRWHSEATREARPALEDTSVPAMYATVVEMLRELDRKGTWPDTGEQRQKRIKGGGDSFTIGNMPSGMAQPALNKTLGTLLAACRELEQAILPMRLPSSTVVVNRNAQFMPHTDSGAGNGQSISMIVGLGDYTGGELVVEGEPNNIRYRPMEFDGWKQRHWTTPFEGERFSIVFFTPYGCTAGAVVRHAALHNGVRMPLVGIGTYRLKGAAVAYPVRAALTHGYRHIDTASVYKNEDAIGEMLEMLEPRAGTGDGASESSAAPVAGMLREHLFVTTKLAPKDQGYEKAAAAVDASIAKLGGRPVDLFLIHWPGCGGKQLDDPSTASMRLESWRALEQALADGKVRSIGISNFQPRHLKHLVEHAKVVPHVHQFEMHPACPQEELRRLCADSKIQVVAYASLGVGALLENAAVVAVANRVQRTPAQVLLRWSIQNGAAVIPKASSEKRIQENHDVFDFVLAAEDMAELGKIATTAPQKYCWDPEDVVH